MAGFLSAAFRLIINLPVVLASLFSAFKIWKQFKKENNGSSINNGSNKQLDFADPGDAQEEDG